MTHLFAGIFTHAAKLFKITEVMSDGEFEPVQELMAKAAQEIDEAAFRVEDNETPDMPVAAVNEFFEILQHQQGIVQAKYLAICRARDRGLGVDQGLVLESFYHDGRLAADKVMGIAKGYDLCKMNNAALDEKYKVAKNEITDRIDKIDGKVAPVCRLNYRTSPRRVTKPEGKEMSIGEFIPPM